MSTRGLVIIRKGHKDKAIYNHYDSYPSALGEKMARFVMTHSYDDMSKIFDKLHKIKSANCSNEDWESLFEECLNGTSTYGHINYVDSADFIKDSLFCEYAYCINLDTETLEVYYGCQEQPDNENRYGCKGTHTADTMFYPCMCGCRFPINKKAATKEDEDRVVEAMVNCMLHMDVVMLEQ